MAFVAPLEEFYWHVSDIAYLPVIYLENPHSGESSWQPLNGPVFNFPGMSNPLIAAKEVFVTVAAVGLAGSLQFILGCLTVGGPFEMPTIIATS